MRILAFGDSLTAGFGLRPGRAFPDKLQAALAAESIHTEMINEGVSGDTTGDGLARVDRALRHRPDLVILELGTNDGLMGVDPQQVRANLDGIIRACLASGASVLLAGSRPLGGWSRQYIRSFEQCFQDLAEEHGLPLFPDFLAGVAGSAELTLFDAVHPNEQGVDRIVEGILPLVRQTVT